MKYNEIIKCQYERGVISPEVKQSIKEYFGIDIDAELLSPLVDYIFKRIFTADEERSKIALIDFLNSALGLSGSKIITDLTVISPVIPVDVIKRKKSIFDVRASFNNGEQCIIEMQVVDEHDFKKRSQFIISRAYVSQNISGLNYNALKKCYLIAIVNRAATILLTFSGVHAH